MALSLNYTKQNGLKDNLRCKRHQTPEGLLIHECGILSVRLGIWQGLGPIRFYWKIRQILSTIFCQIASEAC